MAKITIDTDYTLFFERAFLSNNKINMDCKMILRSLIALYKQSNEDPVVSLQFFEKQYGLSNRRTKQSIKILENKKLLKSYFERESDIGEIYRFKLNTFGITEKFPIFKFK